MKKRTIYLLGLLGGIITAVFGFIVLIICSRAAMIEQFGAHGIYYSIWTIGIGILMLIGASLISKGRRTIVGAILLIVFGIAGIITLTGLIAGPLLSLIAGAAAIKKK